MGRIERVRGREPRGGGRDRVRRRAVAHDHQASDGTDELPDQAGQVSTFSAENAKFAREQLEGYTLSAAGILRGSVGCSDSNSAQRTGGGA